MHKSPESITASLLAGVIREGGATVSPSHNVTAPATGYMVGAAMGAPALTLQASEVTAHEVESWVTRALAHITRERGATSAARCYLGIWQDPDQGAIYLDVSEHYAHRGEAILTAIGRHEVSIYDLAHGTEIRTLPRHYDGTECRAAHERRDCERGHTYAA